MDKLKQLQPGLNAYTFRFDEGLLDEIRASFASELRGFLADPATQHLFRGGATFRLPAGRRQPEYFIFSYDAYPLLWFSNNTALTYGIYRRFFDALAIADDVRELVDHENGIVMYCGFLVIGDRAPEPLWHIDYQQGANAYTLITPLFELEPGHGHLLYKGHGDRQETYTYRLGEAIVLGENFLHTTAPYPPHPHKRVLVSLTFGTDKLMHWPQLQQAVKVQSNYYVLPCGHPVGSCHCLLQAQYQQLKRRLMGG